MQIFTEHSDTPLIVTMKKHGKISIVNADKQLISTPDLVRVVTKEIEGWKLSKKDGSFQFSYSIRNKGDESEKSLLPHEHKFIQFDCSAKADNAGNHFRMRLYRVLICVYKCEICGFCYKTEIKQLL